VKGSWTSFRWCCARLACSDIIESGVLTGLRVGLKEENASKGQIESIEYVASEFLAKPSSEAQHPIPSFGER
jgi:hypothetical protein